MKRLYDDGTLFEIIIQWLCHTSDIIATDSRSVSS